MLSNNKKPMREPGFRLENMDNESLLFNPKTTNILFLNESASLVWQLCDGQRSIAEIVALITRAYPEAGGSIQKDVEETIGLFIDNGVVLLYESVEIALHSIRRQFGSG
jgi:hypothetical protein